MAVCPNIPQVNFVLLVFNSIIDGEKYYDFFYTCMFNFVILHTLTVIVCIVTFCFFLHVHENSSKDEGKKALSAIK